MEKIVQNFGILNLLGKYIDHIMASIQKRVLWGLSNIAGSQMYSALMSNLDVMVKLMAKNDSADPGIRLEFYFCFLNLITKCNGEQLQQLSKTYNIQEMMCSILGQLGESYCQPLFQRAVYACYHMITSNPKSICKLEQFGLKKIASAIYEKEKQKQKLEMMNVFMDAIDKAKNENKDIDPL